MRKSKCKVKSKNSVNMEEVIEKKENGKPFKISHRCFNFSKDVILFVKGCQYKHVFSSLFDQLVRSVTSIGANVIEGRAGSSKRDWKKFQIIALKSANESKYWLCLIRDTMDGIEKTTLNQLIKEADEISKIIARIIINSSND